MAAAPSRRRRTGRPLSLFSFVVLCVFIGEQLWTAEVSADHTPDPSSVTIAGSLQSELGCPGDWDPACAASQLAYDGTDDVWQGTFSVPAGSYDYKAALNSGWDENYGANAQQNGPNLTLNLPVSGDVKFYYDHKSHWITDNLNSVIAGVAGDFQAGLGCPGDWQPDCLRSWLQDPEGDGIYSFSTTAIPAGSYQCKVVHNESWEENYGAGGVRDGATIPFVVGPGTTTVLFQYDLATHSLGISTSGNVPVIEVAPPDLSVRQESNEETTQQMIIGNPGSSPLNWTIVEDEGACDSAEDVPWLSVSPAEGTTASQADSNLEVVFNSAGLADGDYEANLCVTSNDAANPLVQVPMMLAVGPPLGPTHAVLHYFRPDGVYGDHTTGDSAEFWGLHLWGDIGPGEPTPWTAPKPFLGADEYGRFAWVTLAPNANNVSFIIHRGDVSDPSAAGRYFDPSVTPEIWLRQGDVEVYTSQAEAQGFVTIHYHRGDGDYGDPTSPDYNDFWGLHLWGDSIAPSEGPSWTDPKRWTGSDDYGVFWKVSIVDASEPVWFILHRGDNKDTGPDRSFAPLELATLWVQAGDETNYPHRGAAEDFAILHYRRPSGDYGNPSSDDYNDFWGLSSWGDAPDPGWTTPWKPVGSDVFGVLYRFELYPDAHRVSYALHRGDQTDPGPDQLLVLGTHGHEVWQVQGADPESPYVLPFPAEACPETGGDVDADGWCGQEDNCPTVRNLDQSDLDGDEVGDACDNCRNLANADPYAMDRGGSGGQLDDDEDGIGNHCDGDFTEANQDGFCNVSDLLLFLDAFGKKITDHECTNPEGSPAGSCARYDLTGEGAVINVADLLALLGEMFGTPAASHGCAPGDDGIVHCPLP